MEENKDLQEQDAPTSTEDSQTDVDQLQKQDQEETENQENENEEEKLEELESDEEDDYEKLFTVPFNINADELYNFQIVMAKGQIEKNKKRSKLVSIVEIILGFGYLGIIWMGKAASSPFQYLMVFALIAIGVYGLVYYKYFFYPALRKSVNKQHTKVPYFNKQIELDIYPNKCVERFDDKATPNFWRNTVGVIKGSDAYYVQLDNKHCLLIPKRCALPQLEPFLRKMCEDFEKKWTEI